MNAKLILTALLIVATGCAPLSKGVVAHDAGGKEMGVASWYGEEFHGRLAANGERFDMYAVSAAHRTLPLGSIVRVLNVRTGKHLYVPITDRGPYVPGRMLDLSFGAAEKLGMSENGLAPVFVEVVDAYRMLHDEHHLPWFIPPRPTQPGASLERHLAASPWSPANVTSRRPRRSRPSVEHDEREAAIVGQSAFSTSTAELEEEAV